MILLQALLWLRKILLSQLIIIFLLWPPNQALKLTEWAWVQFTLREKF
jgi:hypothetical protein